MKTIYKTIDGREFSSHAVAIDHEVAVRHSVAEELQRRYQFPERGEEDGEGNPKPSFAEELMWLVELSPALAKSLNVNFGNACYQPAKEGKA